MANQRAEGKRVIGAYMSREVSDAVDKWLLRNPPKTVTDFLIEAALEKLKLAGIPVDPVAALRDRRGRLPKPGPAESKVSYKKSKSRPQTPEVQAVAEGLLIEKTDELRAKAQPSGKESPPARTSAHRSKT